jgi:hypothetical protein
MKEGKACSTYFFWEHATDLVEIPNLKMNAAQVIIPRGMVSPIFRFLMWQETNYSRTVCSTTTGNNQTVPLNFS